MISGHLKAVGSARRYDMIKMNTNENTSKIVRQILYIDNGEGTQHMHELGERKRGGP